MKSIKAIAILLTPLLLFAILLVPYSLANQHFIVDWLGCGCPVTDEAGNIVENYVYLALISRGFFNHDFFYSRTHIITPFTFDYNTDSPIFQAFFIKYMRF